MEQRLPETGGGDDFRSCCGDDEEWEDTEESFTAAIGKGELDEASVRLFFKGVSSSSEEEAEGKKLSGIGVVMERSPGVPVLKVQKKLDFYVEELVAEHLALMDGLLVALQNGIRKIFAFTNSEKLYFQIAEAEILEDQLLVALGHRILELVEKLEDFDLILLPSFELERPLRLAKEAIGIRYVSPYEVGTCPICCEEKLASQMIKAGCSHTFCYSCLNAYVEERLQTSKLPIRCPQLRCKYLISACECKSFLPVSSYDSLERTFAEAGNSDMERFYCPFPNCSVLLDLSQHFSRVSSSSQSDLSCVECPECHRDICVNCGVPWHIMMSCDEYQRLPVDERDAGDLSLHQLAQNNSWRRCQRCRRMIELTQGCFHMTCWCGHEFCRRQPMSGDARSLEAAASALITQHAALVAQHAADEDDLRRRAAALEAQLRCLQESLAALDPSAVDKVEEDLERARVAITDSDLASFLPGKRNGKFLMKFIGPVNVRVARKEDRLKIKDEYNNYRDRAAYLFLLFPSILLLLGWWIWEGCLPALAVQIYQAWLLFLYTSFALQENVLIVNGSDIRPWWIYHHYLAMIMALVSLTWEIKGQPECSSKQKGVQLFLRWAIMQGIAMHLQNRYQRQRLRTRIALGKAKRMDVVAGETAGVEGQLLLLYPVLFILQGFEAYVGVLLLQTALHGLASDWQVVVCGILLVIMAVGNFVNTVETLILKLRFKAKMKRGKSRQDRPHQN